jgi:hypothetical protein
MATVSVAMLPVSAPRSLTRIVPMFMAISFGKGPVLHSKGRRVGCVSGRLRPRHSPLTRLPFWSKSLSRI